MSVTAWMEGFEEPLGVAVVSSGTYALVVPQYGAVSFSGKDVAFKLGDRCAQEKAVWQSSEGKELNLTALR